MILLIQGLLVFDGDLPGEGVREEIALILHVLSVVFDLFDCETTCHLSLDLGLEYLTYIIFHLAQGVVDHWSLTFVIRAARSVETTFTPVLVRNKHFLI